MNAPVRLAYGETADPSFIRELCIALAHRWEPERLFVIFTAYFDEADSHGKAHALTMGALIGTARQWDLLERRLRALQRAYRFKVLHTTDIKSRTGEFRGWSQAKCGSLVKEIADAMGDHLTEGISLTLPRELYLDHYRNTPFPPKMQPDSQWGLCFRGCLERLVQIMGMMRGKNTVHVVVESGHPNAGAAVPIFAQAKADLLEAGVNLFGTVTYGTKDDCLPLMVADLQAHTFKVSDDLVRSGQPGYFDRPGSGPRPGAAPLTMLEMTPESINGSKTAFEIRQRRKQEAHLKRKAAWQASQKDEP